MAFKVASDKKQRSLRRVLPNQLGDFEVDELPNKDLYAVLKLKMDSLQEKIRAIPKTRTNKQERAAVGLEIASVAKELGRLRDEIAKESSQKQDDWKGFLIQAARELLGPEKWQQAISMANERSAKFGFRK